MKWITREKIKVDRVACPWLIKKFVDRDAEFIFFRGTLTGRGSLRALSSTSQFQLGSSTAKTFRSTPSRRTATSLALP